jgi:hypothetical protein
MKSKFVGQFCNLILVMVKIGVQLMVHFEPNLLIYKDKLVFINHEGRDLW